jgi:hypothetical protein
VAGQSRCLRQEQLNDDGRLIPEGLQRKRKRARNEADEDNATSIYGEPPDAAE